MIDPYLWRRRVARLAAGVRRRAGASRWTSVSAQSLEADLMTAFYLVHQLLADHRLGADCEQATVRVREFEGSNRLEHLLDPERARREASGEGDAAELTVPVLANRVLHAYLILSTEAKPGPGEVREVLVCSDFEQRHRLFRVSLAELLQVLDRVAGG